MKLAAQHQRVHGLCVQELDNYADNSKGRQSVQEARMKQTLERLRPFHVTRVCRNYTTECAKLERYHYFDFIYVDARHDYKGVQCN